MEVLDGDVVRVTFTRGRRAIRSIVMLGLAVLSGACGGVDTVTAPSDTTVAEPTVLEEFSDTLPIGGSRFYSFVVGQNGTVNVTLASVTGPGVPSTVKLALGIGTPSGTGCSASSIEVQGGVDPQVTGTYNAGRYCVNLSDIGNLFAPATFVITIAHP